MKNIEIFHKTMKSVNTRIEKTFHIGSMIDSDTFFDFIIQMDEYDFKNIAPELSIKKIKNHILNREQTKMLFDNNKLGFIAEVYHAEILSFDGNEYEVNDRKSYISIVYGETFDQLIENALSASKKQIEIDLERQAKKNEG